MVKVTPKPSTHNGKEQIKWRGEERLFLWKPRGPVALRFRRGQRMEERAGSWLLRCASPCFQPVGSEVRRPTVANNHCALTTSSVVSTYFSACTAAARSHGTPRVRTAVVARFGREDVGALRA